MLEVRIQYPDRLEKESYAEIYSSHELAITKYNFGGEAVSATIAMTEVLGCYADAGVYLATLWGGNGYQFAGINLYTNYDKRGTGFGDLLVPATRTTCPCVASMQP